MSNEEEPITEVFEADIPTPPGTIIPGKPPRERGARKEAQLSVYLSFPEYNIGLTIPVPEVEKIICHYSDRYDTERLLGEEERKVVGLKHKKREKIRRKVAAKVQEHLNGIGEIITAIIDGKGLKSWEISLYKTISNEGWRGMRPEGFVNTAAGELLRDFLAFDAPFLLTTPQSLQRQIQEVYHSSGWFSNRGLKELRNWELVLIERFELENWTTVSKEVSLVFMESDAFEELARQAREQRLGPLAA